MRLEDVTPLVLTFNEEDNIARTLARLDWAREILVVDSGSTDRTLEIVRRFGRARVLMRAFDSFARQCNFGLAAIRTPWALALDADYELSEGFAEEVSRLDPGEDVAGYRCRFVYRIRGQPLTGALYPPRCVLHRRDGAQYWDEGHCQRLRLDGEIATLASVIHHDDRKPLARWLIAQRAYATREADHLVAAPRASLGAADRLRLRLWIAPWAAPLYALVFKRGLLDGAAGWHYALQRTLFETLLALELLERRHAAKPLAGLPEAP